MTAEPRVNCENWSPVNHKPNIITRWQRRLLPRMAEHPAVARSLAMQSPVFAYVMAHPESPYGIEPLYRYQIWISPLQYARFIWGLRLPAWQRLLTVSLGVSVGWLWTLFFHQMANIKDVRWRALQVATVLHEAIVRAHDDPDTPTRVDIYGSGSARYAIDAWRRARQDGYGNVFVRFLDNDPDTFNLARRYALSHGIDDAGFVRHFEYVEHNVRSGVPATGQRPDVVTLVGLGDHIDKGKRKDPDADSARGEDVARTNPGLIALHGMIRTNIARNGCFITSYVAHNPEAVFLARVAFWRHRYRSWPVFEQILHQAGWGGELARFSGPNAVQHVVRAKP